jgi:hypothetical protein
MMQSFVNQVIDTLNQEVNALERGIHGYFPFGRQVAARYRLRSPHANPSLSRYDDFMDESEWTVATHIRRIFAKLHVDSRAAMVFRCAPLIRQVTSSRR